MKPLHLEEGRQPTGRHPARAGGVRIETATRYDGLLVDYRVTPPARAGCGLKHPLFCHVTRTGDVTPPARAGCGLKLA